MKKFFKAAYYTVFEFDRFVVLALLLSIPCALLAFVFNDLMKYLFIFLSGAFFSIPLIYLLFQPLTYRLNIQRYTLELKGNRLKKSLNAKHFDQKKGPLRVIFLTDIHLHEFLPSSYLQRVINKTNSLKPDVLIFGGDYIVDELTDLHLLEQLKNFKADIKLGVLGNHDYNMQGKDFRKNRITAKNFRFANKVAAKLETVGITVLRNENYHIKNSNLNIFGLDDLWVKKSDMSKFIPSKYNIVVTHNPRNFTELSNKSINLVFSGHNHGGGHIKLNKHISLHRVAGLIPISPFSSFNAEFGKYVSGVYKNNFGLRMYSSTGVGLTGLGVRVNCRPEIVVVDAI